MFFFSKEIKMPFLFSETDNVEEAKIHDKLQKRRKRPAVTTIFFREKYGIFGWDWECPGQSSLLDVQLKAKGLEGFGNLVQLLNLLKEV